MAQLLVRDIEDEVKQQLKQRAAKHGRSMEAEIRDILRAAVAASNTVSEGLGTRIRQRFQGSGLKAGELEELPDWDIHTSRFGQ